MAVRGEEVTRTIETHIRQSIERMVGEVRSSLDDIRAAVDQQLKAAVQSVQADANSFAFPSEIAKTITEFEEAMTPKALAAPAGANASRVKAAVQAVERGRSQVDVLNSMLEQCLQFGSRAALLILKGDSFAGWKGLGFSAHGGNDEMVKRFTVAPGTIIELDQVLRQERVVSWDGASLSSRLGVPASRRAIAVPMVIKDKVAAAVYVDAVEADLARFDEASVELLVFTTGLLIDTLAIRKKTPSPSLSAGDETVAPAFAAAPAPPQAHTPATPQRPTFGGMTPTPMSAASSDETVAISAHQIRDMMAAPAPPPAPSFEARPQASAPAPRPAPPPLPPPQPAPSHPAPPQPPPPRPAAAHPAPARPFAPAAPARPTAAPAEGERPSTQYVPPTGVGRGSGFGTAMTEEAKKHDEARRFARLLVSEIKLYNEAKVEQGRKNHDLYERLKEDIDRSRQMYDERIADDVRKVSNYFYDELVRILADGSTDVLGL
jgi:hypothetical protein